MAAPPSYTRTTHTTYPQINPEQPALSNSGKTVVITGASGGIGRATALSFARSAPTALILLGRRADALAETSQAIQEACRFAVQTKTYEVDLCDAFRIRSVLREVNEEFGIISILVHCAGVLAPVKPLLDVDPTTFLDGYKTTVIGTLSVAQAVVLANGKHAVTFINLTTAGILFPPFACMGAYVSSKMAAVKLLQSFAVENPQVRLHHVHPGLLKTTMSAKLEQSIKLPYGYDDISLPADYLVWLASRDAEFTKDRIVFAAWDVVELETRKKEIVGTPMGGGDLLLGYSGFPRYVADQAVPGV